MRTVWDASMLHINGKFNVCVCDDVCDYLRWHDVSSCHEQSFTGSWFILQLMQRAYNFHSLETRHRRIHSVSSEICFITHFYLLVEEWNSWPNWMLLILSTWAQWEYYTEKKCFFFHFFRPVDIGRSVVHLSLSISFIVFFFVHEKMEFNMWTSGPL